MFTVLSTLAVVATASHTFREKNAELQAPSQFSTIQASQQFEGQLSMSASPVSMAYWTQTQINTVCNWSSTSSITMLYEASAASFYKADLLRAIAGKQRILLVGRTYAGQVVGGYTGNAVIPTGTTSSWLTSSNMFIFNLGTSTKWSSSYSSLNIWYNSYPTSTYNDIIDFGYHNALQFECPSEWPKVSYMKSNDFVSDPTNLSFGIPTTDTSLQAVEAYQLN